MATMSLQTRQQVVLLFTAAYFFMELFGGLYYHSIALTTDASFMAINIVGQLIALYVERLAKRAPDSSKTFGYERAKVLSGLVNGILVGFIIFYVFIHAYARIKHPEPLEADKILFIAAVGLAVNAFGLVMMYPHSKNSNIKGAFLLLLNDTLGSVGVIIAAVLIKYTHLYFIDPVAGILVGLLTAYPTTFLFKDSIQILMEGNYPKIDIKEAKGLILHNFKEVAEVKDMHIWALSSEFTIMALRIRTRATVDYREEIRSMKRLLKEKYGFSDVFIEGYQGRSGSLKGTACQE